MVSQTWKAFTNKLLTFNYSFLDFIPLNVLHWCLTGRGGVHAEIVVLKSFILYLSSSLRFEFLLLVGKCLFIQVLFFVFLIIAWLYYNF